MSDVELETVSLASSSNGRVSGKAWKNTKTATVRTRMPDGVRAKGWEDRMQKTERARAIKKLQSELKDEKQSELQRRRQITNERKRAAEEKKNIQDNMAKLGARRTARLRRKMGRTKKINH